jgi:hypothetical protein
MAKVKHVSQFAHDIAVRVLERFDKYGVCKATLARNAADREVDPRSADAVRMCVTGRIVNACPEGADKDADYRIYPLYHIPAVKEIVKTVYGPEGVFSLLHERNDSLFDTVGSEALKARTRRLFERIAALPVVDENPTEFRVGGVYQSKELDYTVTVARIVPADEHTRATCGEAIAEYNDWEYDRMSFIQYYRRVR